mgnify:FL=1
MKKKSIIAICAVLVILILAAVLVLTGNRGNVSNVNRVVGYSALYGENSINEAFDVIEKKFAKDFEGCTLTELRYDKDVENRFAEEIEKYHKENNQLGVLITYQRFCFIHASSSTFELFACATHSLYLSLIHI